MDFLEDPFLKKAFDFANLSLAGKKRFSGEDVVGHCLRVEEILWKSKVRDPLTLAVAVLHHSISDGAATILDIRKEFGEDVASMMEAMGRLYVIKLKSGILSKDELSEQLRRMFLVLAKDLRVVLIKLADITDNLTTLEYLTAEKKEEIATETLEIFSPLAERLGMGELKGQMQDLAFKHLYPKEYEWVRSYAKKDLDQLGRNLLKIKGKLITSLKKAGINSEVQSRVKHTYSLYAKLMRPENNKDLKKIFDLIALRIITESTEECYKALDTVYQLFKPVPGYISDYIAHPKPNGYQSVHLKVYGPGDLPFEVQIRSRLMHEQAEYGLAAHWNYTEKKESGLSDEKISQGFAAGAEKLEWVKRLSQWQKEVTNNEEFLKTVKTDFFGQRIFCFTPKGDVKDLPMGATPIDFAYMVHSDMGNLVTGAKVNEKIVSLNTKLKNGDMVELILSKDFKKKPSRDWLSFVVTVAAIRKIKKAYT